jgi:UDP-N-acetylglucosamine:LPS N-acetylglucosamine transferase
MYNSARMVIARAGRNVVSELLYLNIPGLLIATNGDYRSKEQEKNIDMMISVSNHLFDKFNILDDDDILIEKIQKKLDRDHIDNKFKPGNDYAIHIIKDIIKG